MLKASIKYPIFNFLYRIVLFVYLLSLIGNASAQLLDSGQPRPDIDWKQINTRHYQIIFPAEIESEGQRIANILEYLYFPLRNSLIPKSRRWPLVLSNRSAESNGYVTLAPRKSEWYPTPTQSSMTGNFEWYNLLAIHEGRHMVQFDRFNSGLIRLAGLLFGDYAIIGLTVWHTPMWFFEGDAVGTETALSGAGRGRQPEFDLPIRTLLLNGKIYSYDKAYLGSYQDYYPNYYHLGYLMTTHARRQYGTNVWNQVIDSSIRRSWNPFGFSKAIWKITGRRTKGLYYDTMAELDTLWRKQVADLQLTPAKKINQKPKNVWTQYRWPQYLPDESVIAVIYGLDNVNTLVKIAPNGRESEIIKIGGNNRISVADGLIAWDELNPDPRWSAEIASDIVIYDLNRQQIRQITEQGKFFSPTLAPNTKTLAAVRFTPERKCNLVLLETNSGKVVQILPNPDNGYIKNPAWSPDGRQLVYFKQTLYAKSLAVYDLESATETIITPECHAFDEYPVFYDQYILYNSAWSGIDNIYAVDTTDGRRFQVTSGRYGTYYPAVAQDQTRLLFCDYDVNGLDVCEMPLDPQDWRPLATVERHDIRYYEPLVRQEQGGNLFTADKIPQKRFPVTDYYPYKHLLNIHSWYYLISSNSADIGLYSNDLLNTAAINTEVSFNTNEKVFSLGSEICYAGFYPILSAGIGLGQRISYTGGFPDSLTTETWHETAFSFRADLPLDYSAGIHNRKVTFSLGSAYTKIRDKKNVDSFANGNGWFLPVSYGLVYANYQTPARRDVQPTNGYILQFNFQHTPLGGDYRSNLCALQGKYFLPGLARHHSLLINGKIERQHPRNYHFASQITCAKGYDFIYHDLLAGAGLTYEMPLGYPDWALGSLLYIKRLRGAFFGDYNFGKTGNFEQQYNSAGIDLNFDFNILDLYVELNAGLRLAYRFADERFQVSALILGIEF